MNMKIRATRLTLALAAVGLAFVASAQPAAGPPRGPMNFATFDQNGNGVVTEQEFDAARAERIQTRAQQGYQMRNLANAPSFEEIDQNGDGLVNPEEFAQAQAAHMMPRAPR